MKRFLKIAFMAIIGLGIVVFNGCKKDIENTDLKSQTSLKTKSMGNHQQPTQVIDINTTINVQHVNYPVNGNAIVGNFDGRIYECNLMWVVHLDEINEDFPLHLTATLKPEFEDLMTEFEPLMENYIIMVNGTHVEPNFILMENGVEVVDYNAVFELWVEILSLYTPNKTINMAYVLNLINTTGVNIFQLVASPFFLEYVNNLDAFTSHFAEGIKSNIISEYEFELLLQELIDAPLWEEDTIPFFETVEDYLVFQEEYHKFYIVAEQLSNMFFGPNFNHIEIFDGTPYTIAIDRMMSIADNRNMFEQQMISQFPQYANLSEDIQRTVVVVAVLMMGICEDELNAKMKAANAVWERDYYKCKTKKCKEKANAAFRKALNEANREYLDCIENEK